MAKGLQTSLLAFQRGLSTKSITMRGARLDIGLYADIMSTTAINIETELKSDRKRTLKLIHDTLEANR